MDNLQILHVHGYMQIVICCLETNLGDGGMVHKQLQTFALTT